MIGIKIPHEEFTVFFVEYSFLPRFEQNALLMTVYGNGAILKRYGERTVTIYIETGTQDIYCTRGCLHEERTGRVRCHFQESFTIDINFPLLFLEYKWEFANRGSI